MFEPVILNDRTTTWSAIGKSVEQCHNLDGVLAASGLDYTVIKRPVYALSEEGVYEPIPKRFCTLRQEDGHKYDVVSDRFEIIQNRDAFDFVSYMGDELRFLKAGETYNGMVYIIGVLPSVNILGDEFTPHVLFRNGFAGNVKITACICPLRIICQNQFNFSFRNTENAVTIRHMKNAEAKLAEARDVLKMCADYMAELNKQAEQYAGIKLASWDLDAVINNMFPIPVDADIKQAKIDQMIAAREAFRNAYLADDNSNFRGTAWGLVNAYTDFITHREPLRNTKTKDEGRFMTVTFHPGMMNTILNSMSAVGIR